MKKFFSNIFTSNVLFFVCMLFFCLTVFFIASKIEDKSKNRSTKIYSTNTGKVEIQCIEGLKFAVSSRAFHQLISENGKGISCG